MLLLVILIEKLVRYIFTTNDNGSILTQAQKLTPSGADSDYFGRTVALNGNNAVIGAWGDDDDGQRSVQHIF